ncbi:hypothetical protein CHL76_15945 [Marinococcus halophilus]|uniref:DUF418 domain-containing protein n=1 Tax=Marinococcus halophilus TaxID=1371 RepID=A0A510YC25_MARHA|nr:DUF418 domain-containing protein [Marinococcus halophilus]OZT78831.1 hypothetical protein CHL76_15945 [Marinococcus halophilus]GEK60191.1 hypothetical protein MHA01_30960 [Marinococcus halophilus]
MTTPQGSTQGPRIDILDQIRGFALFAIFIVNVFGLALADPANPTWLGSSIHTAVAIVFEDSARPLFAMMFGISLVLIYSRLHAKGTNPYPTLVRRLVILFFVGGLHGYFIWAGDILLMYASAGLVLLTCLRLPASWLLGLAFLFWLGYSTGIDLLNGYTSFQMDPEQWMKDALPKDQTYPTGVEYLLIEWSTMIDHLGYFFFGMYAYRSGIFSRALDDHDRKWRLAVVFLLVGLLGKAALYAGATNPLVAHLDDVYAFLVSLGLGLGLLLAGTSQKSISMFLIPFTAVGKLTFTHYLLQSVIFVSLFRESGRTFFNGMGIWDPPGYVFALFIGLLVFAAQLLASPLWLKYFYYGPLEWVWRIGTHMKWVPMIRKRS